MDSCSRKTNQVAKAIYVCWKNGYWLLSLVSSIKACHFIRSNDNLKWPPKHNKAKQRKIPIGSCNNQEKQFQKVICSNERDLFTLVWRTDKALCAGNPFVDTKQLYQNDQFPLSDLSAMVESDLNIWKHSLAPNMIVEISQWIKSFGCTLQNTTRRRPSVVVGLLIDWEEKLRHCRGVERNGSGNVGMCCHVEVEALKIMVANTALLGN